MNASGPIDTAALAKYLKGRLAGDWERMTIRRFEGGQSNPTFLIEAGALRYVMRKKPPGNLLPSAHAIEREFQIMTALARSDVPVPKMEFFCDDPTVIGTPFFVMELVEGRVINDSLDSKLDPAQRTSIHYSMLDVLAKLHRVDIAAHGLSGFGRPGGYFVRQIDRWTRQFRQSEIDTIPAMDRLIAWLPKNVPTDDLSSIVHGDYRLENLIVHASEPKVVAVLDWELSTLGHPLADLSYNCIPYHLPRRAFGGVADVDLAGSGMPAEADYVAEYARLTGWDPSPHWGFYVAFALFRLAAILQGVRKRAIDGNAASMDAMQRGALAPLCAEAGERAIEIEL